MNRDISGDILAHISNYAIGLVRRGEGAGSQVIGSGVLVSIEGRRGLLTAGHVAEVYAKLPEIGVIAFCRGLAPRDQQRAILDLSETQTIIGHSDDNWSMEGGDLAFTYIPDDIASSLAARSLFLNIERNRAKLESGEPAGAKSFDSILGLVAKLSETPFIENRRFISPVQGILHSGHIRSQQNGLMIVDALAYNIDKLPSSFGGMSGGGLWRTYFTEDESGFSIIDTVLVGIASQEIIEEKRIVCQGWHRIDQGLIPMVRENLHF